ncbi:TIR domain-containing protein, partial [Enterococcus faecalis]|nr:TIR domain-containing protein [Enterococcus faecalis]
GEKVRFKLKKDKAYNNREFSDIGKCKNIYVSYLEKVE